MIRTARSRGRLRRGTVLPLLALLIVVICAMMAFALDLGRVAVCRAQLQNAADAAALAAASALGTDNQMIPYRAGNQTTDISSARTLAQKFAQANSYDLNGALSVVLDATNDVSTGALSYPYSLSSNYSTSGSVVLNSVRIQTYIDTNHGGSQKFLFAPVLNQFSTTIEATATATVQLFPVASTKWISGLRSPLLPITMSLSDWEQMVDKQTGMDTLSYDAKTGKVVSGSDGLYEQQLYPGSNTSSSNNGLIQFGTSSHSNSVLSDEIANGPTSTQLLLQWPPNGTPPWNSNHEFTLGADPGWRASDFDALAEAIGDVRLIPINDGTPPGNGANGKYTIVKLAPVRIMTSDKGGKSSGSALVQPAVLNDPTLVPGSTPLDPSDYGQGGIPVSRLTR